MECIFCKIVKKEIAATILYEDEFSLAFLDAHPHGKGHTLIVPKEHFENLLITPIHIQEQLLIALNKAAEILQKQYSPTGFNISSNIGKSAGQVIFHTHIHIIPRYEGVTLS